MRIARYLGLVALFVTAYCLATRVGLFLQVNFGGVTPLWPASGIGLALLWRGGWKWVPVILVGEFINAAALGQPAIAGINGGIAQFLEAAIAVMLLRRAKVSFGFDSTRDLGLFIVLGCLLPPVVSASLGALGLWGAQVIAVGDVGASWFVWWLGDAMGLLVLTPFLMLWSRWPLRSRRQTLRWLALSALFCACGAALVHYSNGGADPLFFLLLPFMAIMAAYVGAAGAASLAVLFAGVVLGMGLDHVQTDFIAAVRIAFVGTSTFTGLLIAAAMAERRQIDRLLGAEQRRALATMRSIGDGVLCVNEQGLVSFINPAAERLTGWPLDEAAGRPIEEVLRIEDSAWGGAHPARRCIESGQPQKQAMLSQVRDRAGRVVAAEYSISPIHDTSHALVGAVVAVRDVTVERELRARLVYQASHDVVTGLGNRNAFDARLQSLAGGTPCVGAHALLYLDLDQFKLVNDSCGHQAGDRLLSELAQVLSAIASSEIYRLGGDEFGVPLANATEQDALDLADRLRRAVVDFRFTHGDQVFTLGTSIGITTFAGGETSPDEILSRADIACYMAKDAGRNRIQVYRAGDIETMMRHTAIHRLSQLQAAMDAGRFQLYCQRIARLDGAAGERAYFEVLLRLREDGHFVGPDAFLPIAQRFGLMPFIDRWVVEQTFRYLGEHRDAALKLSMNLTGTTLDDPDFPDFVTGLRKQYAVDPHAVCFEVTESVAIERLTRVANSMRRMREEGYCFALDDFGSGVASFAYLQDLPVDFVKIDGLLVRNMAADPANEIIVEALVRLARRRGITCVAEWIEDGDAAQRLHALGVELGQGFFLHKPQPLAELASLLEAKESGR